MEGDDSVITASLTGMIGAINKLKAADPLKWTCLLDMNGQVATFMKYKAHYFPAYEFLSKSESPNEDKMTRFICGGLFSGGTTAFDVDSFNVNFKVDDWFKTEWLGENFYEPKKFLNYDSIVELGKRYPKAVNEIVG